MTLKEKPDIAVFHAFFNHKGGGEKLVFELRNRFKADLFSASVNFNNYGRGKEDDFSKELFDSRYNFDYFHSDGNNSITRILKRLYFFLFSPKVKQLAHYKTVIFSGNVMFVQRRLRKIIKRKGCNTRLVMYCHTPPRKLTDQFQVFVNNAPALIRPFFRIGGKFVLSQYIKDLREMDAVITNSANTRKRLLDYTGVDAVIVNPPINVDKFKFISQGDYYLSYARLDDNKRIPLIIEAFSRMPGKKLIICSTGPLRPWLEKELEQRKLTNVIYEGLVTDERLFELVGKCFAGIYIPVNEDFGMTQIEIMSAGKPVIGVKEGGLTETIIDGETGILIKENPSADDLIEAVNKLTPALAAPMKDKCIENALKYSSNNFFAKMKNELNNMGALN